MIHFLPLILQPTSVKLHDRLVFATGRNQSRSVYCVHTACRHIYILYYNSYIGILLSPGRPYIAVHEHPRILETLKFPKLLNLKKNKGKKNKCPSEIELLNISKNVRRIVFRQYKTDTHGPILEQNCWVIKTTIRYINRSCPIRL